MPYVDSERHDRHDAARFLGAGLVAFLAQLIVDMPEGYFGAADEVTFWGWLYGALALALAAAGVWGRLARHRLATTAGPLLYILSIGVFIAPIASDPVVAGGVVLWNVTLLGLWAFPAGGRRRRQLPEEEVAAWLTVNEPAARHLLGISLLLSVVVVGYRFGDRLPALLLCFAVDAAMIALTAPFLRRLWRAGFRWRVLALAPILLAALLAIGNPTATLSALAGYKILTLVWMLARGPGFRRVAAAFFDRPALLVASSFAALVAAGTLFLSFPAASATGRALAPIDALFTATSAACVTGLIVLDTPVDFSPFGQGVILGLIQIGGLNIMVLSAFAAALLGRHMGLRGERALGQLLDLRPESSAYPLIRFIVLSTLAVEGLGTAVLTGAYLARGESFGGALWKGLFHAVSAFCNAGFALHSDSLVGFRENSLVLLTVAILITAGGLGFGVLAASFYSLRGRGSGLTVQTRLVLLSSAVLVIAGTLGWAAGEWHRSLAGLGTFDKWVNAFFQSVTLRTAGFNSVDFAPVQPAIVAMMLVWMFVGASPGGTGGGVKTTTAAVLLSVIPAIARGRTRVVLFRRRLALETVYRSAAIAGITLLLTFAALVFLLATQDLAFDAAVFEVVSAVATVGLTLGTTAELDTLGKATIAGVMFLGRIGPLTLALLLAREDESRLRYPEARVMVG